MGLLREGTTPLYINRYDVLSTPTLSVERAVTDCLGDMLWRDIFSTLKVGNCARNLYDAVVGACREIQMVHGALQELRAHLIQRCELAQHSAIHHGVRVNIETLKSAQLHLAGPYHTLTDCSTGLCGSCVGHLADRDGCNLDMDVDTIHQGA